MSQPSSPVRSVIVGGARTPMGRLLGSLKDFSAADLGGVAIKGALEKAGITGDQVDFADYEGKLALVVNVASA